MATKAQVKAAAAKIGVQVEQVGEMFSLIAPAGKIFDSTFAHQIIFANLDSKLTKAEIYASALNDIEFGLKPCISGCSECLIAEQAQQITYYKHRPSACRAARRAEANDGGSYKVIQDPELGYFIKKQVS